MVHTIKASTASDLIKNTKMFDSDCTKESDFKMTCQYPELEIPEKFLKTVESEGRQRRSTKKFDKEAKNQTSHGADFQTEVDDERLDFFLGFDLDGDESYKNLTESLPAQSDIIIYASLPEFDNFAETKQYEKDMKLQITGKNLNRGLAKSDYNIKIGKGLCDVLSLTDNELVCGPPVEEPEGGDDGKHQVVVFPGTNLEQHIIGMPVLLKVNPETGVL